MQNKLIESVASQIHREPWKQSHRSKLTGLQVTGWTERLRHYCWATKSKPDFYNHMVWLEKIKSNALVGEASKNSQDRYSARCNVACDILEWGGVKRGNLEKVPAVINAVVDAARTGAPSVDTPMNSGWTKIAAIYSLILPGSLTQVIWDSRVSLSICTRLGSAAQNLKISPQALQNAFAGRLGWVPGRGGTRPRLIKLASEWFPNRYGKWNAHFEGGAIVAEMTQVLNANLGVYGNPLQALSFQERKNLKNLGIQPPEKWSPWLVACVLFMDGY